MRNWIIYGFRVACVSNSSHDHTRTHTHTQKKIRKLFFCVSCKLGKKESIFFNSYPFKMMICNSVKKRMSLLLINFSFNHVTENTSDVYNNDSKQATCLILYLTYQLICFIQVLDQKNKC